MNILYFLCAIHNFKSISVPVKDMVLNSANKNSFKYLKSLSTAGNDGVCHTNSRFCCCFIVPASLLHQQPL